jgi:translation initiation factor IF-2
MLMVLLKRYSDSFSNCLPEEIQINIIHKRVGAITETDVMLASASDAIIIDLMCVLQEMQDNLQIRKKSIRYYSIIYAAIDDLKDMMEGMLAPEMKEEILGTAEIERYLKYQK